MRRPKILTTIQDYNWSLFKSDIVAGLTVAMVAMPLSIAIAIASGADPAKGLVTAIIGGFFISLLGGSRVQIGGPTGAFIVVVFGVIADHGYDGLVIATFMAGIILLIGGYLRMGRLIQHVPEAVVNGFTIGIGIIIATSQLKDFFGLTLDQVPAVFLHKLPALWNVHDTISVPSLLIGLTTIVLIIAFRRVAPKLPGLIVAVGVGSAIVAIAGLPVDTIGTRFGALPDQLPIPALPDISIDRISELLPSALVIAFLAGVESLLSAMVADHMIQGQHRPNAELLAQGAANIASSLFGGMPATGAIARTATNVSAGGKTPVAGIVHALAILIAMMLFATSAGYLAMPALAGLLLITAWRMSEPQKWREYMTAPMRDRLLLLITLVLTVLVDLTVAIGVGVSIGLALRLREQKPPPEDWSVPDR